MKPPYFSYSHRGFTLVEVLTVVAIIVILMGLTLGISGFVQDKAARARAEGEIAAMEAALEQFRIDNGGYPFTDPNGENHLSATNPNDVADTMHEGSAPPLADMRSASELLFRALYGVDENGDIVGKTYFNFPPSMLEGVDGDDFNPADVTAILDPWGNPYGYYVPHSLDQSTMAKNPTFDLYSTANSQPKATQMEDADALQDAWVTNW